MKLLNEKLVILTLFLKKAILIEFKNIIWKKVGIIKIVVLFLPGEL